MNVFAFPRNALSLAAAAMLAACTTAASLPQSPGLGGTEALPQGAALGQTLNLLYHPLGRRVDVNGRPDHSRSWMSPDAKRKALLYVGDENTKEVYVYTYPKGELVGELTGFESPFGECADSAGNVWIADGLRSELVEYPHGGTTPINTLHDPGQGPYGCAVNPKSGDLAVANLQALPSGPGSISLYEKAKGDPKVYADPNSASEDFVGYDRDKLYVAGQNSTTGAYQLAAFARKKFTDLTVSGATINYPGGVGFDNGLWIGDGGDGSDNSTNIYQITVSGTTATVIGTTPLTDALYCAALVYGRVALCPGYYGSQPGIEFYQYPAGGSAYQYIGGLAAPYGLAISE
jgi:hypothetical protein